MAVFEDLRIAFKSGGISERPLRLFGVRGEERLSQLFSFELFLGVDGPPLTPDEIDALLLAPCAFAMGPHPGDVVHGVVRSVRSLDFAAASKPRYLVSVVPTAWLLTLGRTNRIFQEMTVPDIAQLVLGQYGLAPGGDFEVRASAGYPTREYVVQYEESDWSFLQRWFEHEGMFYWFEHDGGERLVLADANGQTSAITAPDEIRYRHRNDLGTSGEKSVWEWRVSHRRIPARVALFDYNYRTPHVRLVGKAPIDEENGFGSVMIYGDHFKSNDEGARLANLRAEQHACGRRVFSGWTDCARFRVGQRFTLTEHPEESYNGAYLIVAIEHEVGLPIPSEDAFVSEQSEHPSHYKARFQAIPADVPFRPERTTPWPRIRGIMHAHIDEDTVGEYAQIDDQGRYKVRMPFDSGNAPGAACSRWIRMAQSYSGAGYGSHYPLHRGAEVLVAHVDGDPDRPVIVGTVPHMHTVSPVTASNFSQSVIHTASGIRIELEDLEG